MSESVSEPLTPLSVVPVHPVYCGGMVRVPGAISPPEFRFLLVYV